MSSFLFVGILLIGLAIGLLIMELLVPAGGIMALCSAAVLVGGIVFLFQVDTKTGLVGALLSVLGATVAGAMIIRSMPHSALFQRFRLEHPQMTTSELQGNAIAEESSQTQQLAGVTGVAVTDLRPIGICLLNGKRLDCLADNGMILAGSTVRVVSADEFQIKVREEA